MSTNDAEKNWTGVLTINNNTSYKIDWFFTSGLGAVKHTKGHTVMTIEPGQQGATHTVTDSSRGFDSEIDYHLWFYTDKPKNAYMKGSVGLGYNTSYANRGDLTTQDIKMYGECNDIYTWWQTGNLTSDQTTLPFSVFNPEEVRNYNMTLTFDPQ